MRDQLLELFVGIDVNLIEGRGGIFEITSEDRVLFSKNLLGRFPSKEDLQQLKINLDLNHANVKIL